ncbi:MAG TPA: hypothetical protein VFQ76_03215, partial [Longimicrobiaceae bacterium]|nr:hypothetical protein [Longimicrobiaceae bacterium]
MAKAHTLVDNFNDNQVDTTLWVVSGNTRETNGRVEIRPQSNWVNSPGYASLATYDLTGSQVWIELVESLDAAGADTGLVAVFTDIHYVQLSVRAGQLECLQVVGGSRTVLEHVPYDPVEHRWLRLREWAGTTYWETSPDAAAWRTLHGRPNPIALTIVQLQFGTRVPSVPSPGVAVFDNFNAPGSGPIRRVEKRRLSAREVREEAAELAAERRHHEHANNNDEANYAGQPFIGNYSKSLRHDALGDPDPVSYGTLLRALQSRDPGDFEEIVLAAGTPIKLTNPQAGLAFDVEGPDAQELTQPPAPRFDSEVTAHEAGELYWMAVARDVWFGNYVYDDIISAAANSLNSEFRQFGGTTVHVTRQNIFRGIFPGEQVGPYVSQFLWKGNVDPRKPDGLGRDANEGFISYGSRVIDQRLIPAAADVDYLTTFSTWLDVQNGVDKRGQDQFGTTRRFIRNLRDGATFVHFDQVIDAFYNAAWILMSEPVSNQLTFQSGVTGRPQIDAEFPKDQGNPYDPPGIAMDSRTQVGFATFGPIHLLQVLGEVLGRALRAVWWQKWGVHRRLRPEEYGGRVHNHITGARTYPLHSSIVTSLQSGGLAPYFGQAGEKFPGSYLLPQAYPEGAPTHPAYGAGHATGSGALATMLKAFFDDSSPIENPLQAGADGLS